MRLFGTGSPRAGDHALGTMARAGKGPMAPPPVLAEPIRTVADVVAGWSGVEATAHWHLHRRSQVDGINFYLGEQELGHIHLDGSIHLATTPTLGIALVAEGRARPIRHVHGWVEETISNIGADAAVALFRRNSDQVSRPNIG